MLPPSVTRALVKLRLSRPVRLVCVVSDVSGAHTDFQSGFFGGKLSETGGQLSSVGHDF